MIDNTVFKKPLKALYHTAGCKLNFAETSSVADAFVKAGISTVAQAKERTTTYPAAVLPS